MLDRDNELRTMLPSGTHRSMTMCPLLLMGDLYIYASSVGSDIDGDDHDDDDDSRRGMADHIQMVATFTFLSPSHIPSELIIATVSPSCIYHIT